MFRFSERGNLLDLSCSSTTSSAGGSRGVEGDVESRRRETDGHMGCVCLAGLKMKVNTLFLGVWRHMIHKTADRKL